MFFNICSYSLYKISSFVNSTILVAGLSKISHKKLIECFYSVKSQVRTIATLQLHDNGTINESGFEYDTGIQLDVPMSMINGEGIMFQTKKNWKIVDCCVVVVKKVSFMFLIIVSRLSLTLATFRFNNLGF